MALFRKLSGGVSAAALIALTAPVAGVHAQEVTGAIRGAVVDASGAPVADATVTIVHNPTGATSVSRSGDTGAAFARNLRVGGPYTITVTADGYAPTRVEDVYVTLGETTDVTLTLQAGAVSSEVIVVTGSAVNIAETAIGPTASFGLETLQEAPAINRTINDIVRIDPSLYVDEAFVDGIQCAGANPRFNSLTVDGVRLNDAFGLNSNGFPTERQPFSYDAIEQVAVELAPFDVQYGGFSACNINAVTKSGGNAFHGGAFVDYTSDSLSGDSLEGDPVDVAEFDEYRYGFNVQGPIIEDRLFFSVAYEKLEGANTFDRGPEGSNSAVELPGFTQADFDEIARIARDVYNFDPGTLPRSFDNEDEKLLVRLDWEINDQHRANLIYNYNDGFNINQSDGDSDEFEYSQHLYERGAELNSVVGSLFSDWTENFSTEVRVGYLELDNRQISNAEGLGFAEVQVEVNDNTIYLGQDDSRQANDLNYETMTLLLRGYYDWNAHSFTFGYEREDLDVFNLFVQHTEGQIEFDSIADFEAGVFSAFDYANSPTGDLNDAAAEWGYAVNTVYAQDEWTLPNGLTLTGGLRYDWYTSDDTPAENPDFVADYGFTNAQNLDGEGLLQPRFGFQYDYSDTLTFRGGVGLYSGGNPNVWLSNNYSATNVTQFTVDEDVLPSNNLNDLAYTMNDGPGGPGYGIPVEMADAVANRQGSNFEINYLDPNFEIPSEWKVSLGATWLYDAPLPGVLGGEYLFNADLLYSRDQDAAVIRRGDLEQIGTGPAGLPIFDSVRLPSFVLTNADSEAEDWNVGFTVQKEYDFGLDWTLGYAYSDAEDVQPMTSSVAFSNYNNRAYVNPQIDEVATSNYNIENRFTLLVNYENEFVRDYATRLSLFALASEGRPYSYTFGSNSLLGFNPFQGSDSSLLYVPDGANDPNVVFDPGFDQDAFFAFLSREGLNGYAGGYVDRNDFNSGWWTKADLRIEQELPGLRPSDRSAAFIVIDNVTNLINDEWGVMREASFPRLVDVVDASLINGGSQILFEDFNANRIAEPRVGSPSLWSVRIGLRYEF
ncbi:cell envelope biogenesis protein OmpA [Marinicauda salina]|uniref:Cell envelope biogenesis protein OmpA n=1 Tax=Marinicauda salina TaxID=2135793 RepID=A0A2U2BQV9_9PROT|nr:TonB-dependent receptor [Marinicauda salina]PWE16393.1 cell envelope biogenesis protein OmpA [Marinicauda salina]